MTDLRLDGKTIIVTGATQGVGEGIAREAAAAGAAGLCITGRNAQRGEAIAAELNRGSCAAMFMQADLAKEKDCRSVVARTAERFGAIDGLVNSAGLTDRSTIEETTVELWDQLFAVNTRAPFILTQEMVRHLKPKGLPGSIVNISSRASHGGQPSMPAYAATKGALVTLTKNNAHALRHARIRVNAVNIGWTDTPGEHDIKLREGHKPDWLVRAEASRPFGRLLKPADIATLVVFLLSDAGQMMTGSIIDFDQTVMGAYDGGMTGL